MIEGFAHNAQKIEWANAKIYTSMRFTESGNEGISREI
jgi:hypothetical protein